VFSPYYAWARRGGAADPMNHCALNVALYSPGAGRWCMTERGARHCQRDAQNFVIGPSRLHWDGQRLMVDIDEVGMPIPHRVRGRITLEPTRLFQFSTPLEASARHRWGPIAPQARVQVELTQPRMSWQGHAYLDSNEGDEPIERGFGHWDWSRGQLSDGSTAVIYDIEPDDPSGHVLALRSQGPVQVLQQLEDTPFYQRSVLRSRLLDEEVTSFHETLSVPRLVNPIVRAMLPWRMPRRP
jgi:carotenoid 1,2-hydratase